MSEQVLEEVTEDVPQLGTSLEARLERRRDELERNEAEVFAVPGWEDVFAVRLRKVSGKQLTKIARKHSHIRDEFTRMLYTAADQIIAGTVGFYDLDDYDGELPGLDEPVLEGMSWERMARAADKTLGADLTARQALLVLISPDGSEQRLASLLRDWSQWMETGRPPVDRRLAQDFQRTR